MLSAVMAVLTMIKFYLFVRRPIQRRTHRPILGINYKCGIPRWKFDFTMDLTSCV